MTLSMTFGRFEGCAYLTTIEVNPVARCNKRLQVQDELLICRDHFAIRDICSTRDQRHNGGMRDQSLFYRTLKVREIGRKGSTIRIFSDVGAIRLSGDPLTNAGGFPERPCSTRRAASCARMEHDTIVPATHDVLVFQQRLHAICLRPVRIS
jgi:hypothetical protein